MEKISVPSPQVLAEQSIGCVRLRVYHDEGYYILETEVWDPKDPGAPVPRLLDWTQFPTEDTVLTEFDYWRRRISDFDWDKFEFVLKDSAI